MAECLVSPIASVAQPTAAAELAGTEGPATDFTVELSPEEELEAAGPEAAPVEDLAADPLQMLIEDLSGITGALREATPRMPGKTAVEAMPAEAASSAVPAPLSGLPLDVRGVAPVDPAQSDGAAEAPRGFLPSGLLDILPPETQIETAATDPSPADMVLAETEALLADPAAGPLPALLRDLVVPAEARLAKAAVVPVARQIAEAVVTARDDLVEIALAPEELGKIRMVLSGPDHNPHVTVWVERPEVLDQLRRNAAVLQECLGDAGMPEASFEFHGDTPSDSGKGHPGAASAEHSPAFDASDAVRIIPVAWTPMAIPARLDIRI